MLGKTKISNRLLIKFLLISAVGIFAFMFPVTYQGGSNTVVGILTGYIKDSCESFMVEIIFVLVATSLIGSIIDYVLVKFNKNINPTFHSVFKTNLTGILSKFYAFAVVFMYCFKIGPELFIGEKTGGYVISMMGTVVALAIAMSFLLPFLTDGGMMEFFCELTKKFVRPLFKVPSDASLDLIASWFGASSAAVILSAEKYKKGYYTQKEAVTVMANFSLVSVPFCMVVASTAGVSEYFPIMYMLLLVLGIVIAIISPRIYPINKLSDEYYSEYIGIEDRHTYNENDGIILRALYSGTKQCENFSADNVLKSGFDLMISMTMGLLPVAIAWSSAGIILVEYTKIIQYISWPLGWTLNIMGVEEAFAVAPATIVGFIDMYIPAVLVTAIGSIKTRFIIATLSLIQIIYLAEVGAVILQAKLGVDFKKLFLIFLQRTIIALPIIVLVSNIIF